MRLKGNKNLALLAISAGYALLAACGGQQRSSALQHTDARKDTATCSTAGSDLNPNGTSELAALMRLMFTRSEEWKKAIEQKQELGIYPVAFDKLKTATPTDAHMKNETFDPFADDFIRRTKELLAAPPQKQKEAFANYTEGCMNCHTTMCPGPVKRIRLLRIEP